MKQLALINHAYIIKIMNNQLTIHLNIAFCFLPFMKLPFLHVKDLIFTYNWTK